MLLSVYFDLSANNELNIDECSFSVIENNMPGKSFVTLNKIETQIFV